MRSVEELTAEHDRYLSALQSRFGSVWPSRLEFAVPPGKTIGSFAIVGDGDGLWIEPLEGSQPMEADLLAAIADEMWNMDRDPYLAWRRERFPMMGEVVDSARAAARDIDIDLYAEPDSSFLYVVDESSFRPARVRSGVEVKRATSEDDLLLLSKVLFIAESHPWPEVDAALGVRAIPGVFGDPRLRARFDDGELAVFFAVSEDHPVAVGFHRPLDGATELRVGCLPESRRQGFGGAVLEALVRDAFERRVETVFACRDVDDPRSLFGFSMVSEVLGLNFLHFGMIDTEQRQALRAL